MFITWSFDMNSDNVMFCSEIFDKIGNFTFIRLTIKY